MRKNAAESLILLHFHVFMVYFKYYKSGEKIMSESAKDIQLLELKDTIAQLNNLIKNQSEIMAGLQKTIDNLRLELINKQSELDYCKAKLFGTSSEKSKTPFP